MRLEIIKRIFSKGKYLMIQYPSNVRYKFYFDKNTDNGFILGFYEKELVKSIINYLKPGQVFYDLGAAWGYFSLIASRIVGNSGKVYAFEPLKSNFKRMKFNIHENRIKNIINLEYAISNFDGTVQFSNNQSVFANSYKLANVGSGKLVPSYRLDTLIFQKSYASPNFIKIDVEGAEYDVLEGSTKTIEKFRPVIHLSVHEFYNLDLTQKCDNFLKRRNYDCKILNEKNGITDYLYLPK